MIERGRTAYTRPALTSSAANSLGAERRPSFCQKSAHALSAIGAFEELRELGSFERHAIDQLGSSRGLNTTKNGLMCLVGATSECSCQIISGSGCAGAWFGQPIDQTYPVRLEAIDRTTGEQEINGGAATDQLGETLGSGGTWEEAKLDFGNAEFGFDRGNSHRARHRQFQASTQRMTIDSCNRDP